MFYKIQRILASILALSITCVDAILRSDGSHATKSDLEDTSQAFSTNGRKEKVHGDIAKDLETTPEPTTDPWMTCKTSFPSSKRIAILFTGEAFRNSGDQLQRGMCNNETIEAQRSAGASHVKNLIAPLSALGYEASVFGAIYPCTNGWTSMPQTLSEFYGNHMTKLAVINRSEQEFGGQVHSYRAAMADAMASGIEYDYYFVMRWDLVILAPVDLHCALDGKGVARHIGMLHGKDTKGSVGHYNVDWMLVVPGQLSKCFSTMLNVYPEVCCSPRCLGPACSDCADMLNQRVAQGIDPVVPNVGASCPDSPITLSRASEPMASRGISTCKCCQELRSSSLLAAVHTQLLNDDSCRCPHLE